MASQSRCPRLRGFQVLTGAKIQPPTNSNNINPYFMAKHFLMVLMLCWSPLAPAALGLPAPTLESELAKHLRGAYPNWARDLDWPRLRAFYQERRNQPLWSQARRLRPQANMLLKALVNAHQHGLDPREYHVEAIRYLWRARRPRSRARLELLLTDAFFRYATEVRVGYQFPRKADPEWYIHPDIVEPIKLLQQAWASEDFAAFLAELPPPHPGYRNLQRALRRYQTIAEQHGDWPRLPDGASLDLGSETPAVAILRQRLHIEGFLPAAEAKGTRLDQRLQSAIRRFQDHYGLISDGIVGPATRRALNVPLPERIAQLQQNMERWRWLPRELGARYVLVNMPGYQLSLFERNQPILSMRAIIGKPHKATPSFADEIEYLVLNPDWNIPAPIARDEFLPLLKHNPEALEERHIHVFASWQPGAAQLDPQAIDWRALTAEEFSFKLVQQPSEHNSLGRIKFMFPNSWRIYLHDTPQRHLFQQQARAFSAGCIRVEQPLVLAAHLLARDPAELQALVDSGQTQRLDLPEPVPIYLLYMTAWADDQGRAWFRDDIYQRNHHIATAPFAGLSPAQAKTNPRLAHNNQAGILAAHD